MIGISTTGRPGGQINRCRPPPVEIRSSEQRIIPNGGVEGNQRSWGKGCRGGGAVCGCRETTFRDTRSSWRKQSGVDLRSADRCRRHPDRLFTNTTDVVTTTEGTRRVLSFVFIGSQSQSIATKEYCYAVIHNKRRMVTSCACNAV